MHKLRRLMIMLAMIVTVGAPVAAQTLPGRTFVSGIGNDGNPCTRTAPCQTFAGALVKTPTNGEINCLDPGGFGVVTINKSITIDCEDKQGSILVGLGGTGVSVQLGPANPNDPKRFVRLRGIAINGTGLINGVRSRAGLRGIAVPSTNTAPVTLHVDQVVVDNFESDGILFNGAGGELLVRNSVIQNCGTTGVNPVPSGVLVNSSTSALVHAKLEGSSFIHNQQGVRGENAARITALNCNISNNAFNGAVALTTGTAQAEFNIYNCLISSNRQWGVVASAVSGAAIIRLDGNHIVNNQGIAGAAGVNILNNGQIFSRGNNTINGNTANVIGGTLGTIPNL